MSTTKTIPVDKVTLFELQQRFNLQQVDSARFFPEVFPPLPELSEFEVQRLARIQEIYTNLANRSVLETTVKMAILSPLLDLAGFYLPPFYIDTEAEVLLTAEEDGIPIRGRIDVLVLKQQLWVLVIEAKRAEFSVKVGIPQALTYMLANPTPTHPLYGMVTNGSNFVFLKCLQQNEPEYARSKTFDLEEGTDLEHVLKILKRLAEIVGAE
jgi:predicted type IV restriction endonuclease